MISVRQQIMAPVEKDTQPQKEGESKVNLQNVILQ